MDTGIALGSWCFLVVYASGKVGAPEAHHLVEAFGFSFSSLRGYAILFLEPCTFIPSCFPFSTSTFAFCTIMHLFSIIMDFILVNRRAREVTVHTRKTHSNCAHELFLNPTRLHVALL